MGVDIVEIIGAVTALIAAMFTGWVALRQLPRQKAATEEVHQLVNDNFSAAKAEIAVLRKELADAQAASIGKDQEVVQAAIKTAEQVAKDALQESITELRAQIRALDKAAIVKSDQALERSEAMLARHQAPIPVEIMNPVVPVSVQDQPEVPVYPPPAVG